MRRGAAADKKVVANEQELGDLRQFLTKIS
jgi:hypothetical protein